MPISNRLWIWLRVIGVRNSLSHRNGDGEGKGWRIRAQHTDVPGFVSIRIALAVHADCQRGPEEATSIAGAPIRIWRGRVTMRPTTKVSAPYIGNDDRQSAASIAVFFFVLNGLRMAYDRQLMIETPARIEPLFFEEAIPTKIADLVAAVQTDAMDLGRDLHQDAAAELAELVRVMNCYYSNLIEGHNTRPRDIEAALKGAEVAPESRPLALEARAHVLVHREIDRAYLAGDLPSATSANFVSWVHRRFYEEMPEEFRFVELPDGTKHAIEPGAFRMEAWQDVAVGQHMPPSSSRVADFMCYFTKRFAMAERSPANRIVAIASAHHRLNYIHPFVDGNGRVSRLMSHAMGLKAGIGGAGLWSISRGFARGLKDRTEYKTMMSYADMPRQGDRDGRGNLSERALIDFVGWTLSVMSDQIKFARSVFALDTLEKRYARLLHDLGNDERAITLVSAVLRQGSIERGQAALILRTSERTARSVLSELVRHGFLSSATPKAPVRIAFPLDYRERLFPALFTDEPINAPASPVAAWGR